MCTVTYLPNAKEGFILTSNRDEKLARPFATEPVTEFISGQEVFFPRDPQAGGSWIAASKDKVVCLLNGAFVKHISQPPYRKSRGLVVLDFFKYEEIPDFVSQYDFQGIEPFTLVIRTDEELCELRWDTEKIYYKSLDPESPYIWSSCTLYSEEVVNKRKSWFQQWLAKNPVGNLQEIRNFHRFTGDGDPNNDLVMNREGGMLTVSMTSIVKASGNTEMIYEDLVNKHIKNKVVS